MDDASSRGQFSADVPKASTQKVAELSSSGVARPLAGPGRGAWLSGVMENLLLRLFFLRNNPHHTSPFDGHLLFRSVEFYDEHRLELEFILCRRFERDSGWRAGRLKE